MSGKPKFDNKYAKEITGKRLLVGLAFLDEKGDLLEKIQFHGSMIRVNEDEGIVILRTDTHKEYKLPPDLCSIQKAKPGEYRLRSTGEIVVDPDYTTSWTITRPSSQKGKKLDDGFQI